MMGDQQGAMADYTQAIQLNARDAQAYVNRGKLYASQGNIEAAKADFQQAATLFLQQGQAEGYRQVLQQMRGLR
jgi:tetratricopeptide (TPR) repeat protein